MFAVRNELLIKTVQFRKIARKVFFQYFMANITFIAWLWIFLTTFGRCRKEIYGTWEACSLCSSTVVTWYCASRFLTVYAHEKNLLEKQFLGPDIQRHERSSSITERGLCPQISGIVKSLSTVLCKRQKRRRTSKEYKAFLYIHKNLLFMSKFIEIYCRTLYIINIFWTI